MDLEAATPATFEQHVGSAFRVIGVGNDEIELRLARVDAGPEQPHAPRGQPFSLTFSGPASPHLAQRIYRLTHPHLGDFEIFLVPIGYAPDGGLLYEAVFN